jgi:hypothetical protein
MERTWRMVRRSQPLVAEEWQRLLQAACTELKVGSRVRLLGSPERVMPVAWGWLRPTILLPAGANEWTRERKWLVLLHEVAHVRRGDCIVQHLAHLSCALYWYNPLAWLTAHRLRRERERACDDVVLGSGLRPSDYAAHLMDLLRSLRRTGLAALSAVPMARRAGLTSRIRDLLDSERSHTQVNRRATVVSALALLVLLASLARVPTFAADLDLEQHGLGAREQWQPQLGELDARLQQPVHLEILGRAAVPALAMLSEETGVSLTVAPENLDTVGERKLTIIAQGCALRSLMAQIPNALQECHWDIDPSGPEPVYLLHRNGSADSAMVQAMEDDQRRVEEAAEPERTARVEAARKALAMSSEELDELQKTDPLLAAAAEDPDYRSRMEMFFSLPQEKMDEFLSTGKTRMALAALPKRVEAAVCDILHAKLNLARTKLEKAEGTELRYIRSAVVDLYSAMLDKPDEIGISYDDRCLARGIAGILLRISPDFGAGVGSDYDAIPPRIVDTSWADPVAYRDLLLKTGRDAAAVDALLADLGEQYDAEVTARRDRKRELEWREPRRQELRRTVTLPFQEPAEPEQMQRFIAKESGLSLVSDYFAAWGPQEIPEEARTIQPIWRLLYLLGESWFESYDPSSPQGYDWNEAGNCLVFHDRAWYYRVPEECLESLVLAYREKLKQQGRFTLDDAAAFLVALDRRRPTHPKLQAMFPRVPRDLVKAGLWSVRRLDQAVLRIYASLAPEQREKARSAAGLPYHEMTRAQKELVLRSSTARRIDRPLPHEEISQAVHRVTRSGFTYKLVVEFPSRKVETTPLELRPVAPGPAATAWP